MRFKVLMAVNMKTAVTRDITPCGLFYPEGGGGSSLKMLVTSYQTT
jgi:hypothetical protein